MKLHQALADNTQEASLATRLRRKRFALVRELLEGLPRPARVLDVGGRQKYWEMMGFAPTADLAITLLNVEPASVTLPHFTAMRGDARDMRGFADGEFDLVFSNSVIEHVGGLDDQRRMAAEVRRVGRRYCVQTPNRNFPIEPHFVFPFFQFLPVRARVGLVRRFSLGWYPRMPDAMLARREVEAIRLLTKAEFAALFPGARMHEERVLGVVKSFTAVHTQTV